jgi:hypothetical protein
MIGMELGLDLLQPLQLLQSMPGAVRPVAGGEENRSKELKAIRGLGSLLWAADAQLSFSDDDQAA